MVKMMLIILMLIFVNACGEKNIELIPKINEQNTTTVIQDDSKNIENIEFTNEVIIKRDFVPAHITNSTIEVVPH